MKPVNAQEFSRHGCCSQIGNHPQLASDGMHYESSQKPIIGSRSQSRSLRLDHRVFLLHGCAYATTPGDCRAGACACRGPTSARRSRTTFLNDVIRTELQLARHYGTAGALALRTHGVLPSGDSSHAGLESRACGQRSKNWRCPMKS